ncbi:MAG: hypothetical protein K5657_06290 [Desulfovibrio sp.]|nr:hypothetical protein [Desulfovibrio sp.]
MAGRTLNFMKNASREFKEKASHAHGKRILKLFSDGMCLRCGNPREDKELKFCNECDRVMRMPPAERHRLQRMGLIKRYPND